MLSAAVTLAASPAGATTEWRRVHKPAHSKHAAKAATSGGPLYKGALLEDADSGRVLMAYNADMEWPPASMAKMMNLLVAQEQINAGRFSGNDLVRISERSAHTGGSRVGPQGGRRLSAARADEGGAGQIGQRRRGRGRRERSAARSRRWSA